MIGYDFLDGMGIVLVSDMLLISQSYYFNNNGHAFVLEKIKKMRRISNRFNILFFVIGMIALISYPGLKEYSVEHFMPRYMIFHWYLLFPMLSFSVGYFLFTMVMGKSTMIIENSRRHAILGILYVMIGVYLVAAILTCIHCYMNFLPLVVADPLLYWMAMIYDQCLLVFVTIGGVYAVAVS